MTDSFEAWLDEIDPSDLTYEEVEALLYAVKNRETCGSFRVSTRGEQTFVSAVGIDEPLALLSEKARLAFLDYASERCNPHPDMSIDGAIAYGKAMAKND